MTQNYQKLIGLIVALVVGLVSTSCLAQEFSEAVGPVPDDVVAVGFVDLTQVDLGLAMEQFKSLGFADPSEMEQLESISAEAKRKIEALQQIGLSRAYVLMRISDVASRCPTIMFPVDEGKNAEMAYLWVKESVEAQFRRWQIPVDCELRNSTIYLTGQGQLDETVQNPKETTRNLTPALDWIDGSAAGLLICGDADSRRVIRELVPSFPYDLLQPSASIAELGIYDWRPSVLKKMKKVNFPALSGQFIADDLNGLAVKINLNDQISAQALVKAKDNAAAKEFHDFISQSVSIALEAGPDIPANLKDFLRTKLKPQLQGEQVVVNLEIGDVEAMSGLLLPLVRQERASIKLQLESNHLRQLALAMHNYESVFGKFPDPFGKKVDGQGLSWRVHLLPFLEQNELYKKFHLDEPWSSEHNRKLIDSMPDIFRSPVAQGVEKNKTVYQVPVSPTAFYQPDEEEIASFKDIIDGTSNTIFIVTTLPERAVIWTKPEDWKVDQNDPLSGLKDAKRKKIFVAMMDGSWQALSSDIEPEVLNAMITRAGGEVILRN